MNLGGGGKSCDSYLLRLSSNQSVERVLFARTHEPASDQGHDADTIRNYQDNPMDFGPDGMKEILDLENALSACLLHLWGQVKV